MAGSGAPEGNTYAKKADTGKTISLYIKADDMTLLRLVLQQYGQEPTDQNCIELAKKAALTGIYRLLSPMKESETMTLYTYSLSTSQSARINLDSAAVNQAYDDADAHYPDAILSGEDISEYANTLVDLALEESKNLTDDIEEYRARFVDAYGKAYRHQIEQKESEQ